LKAWIAETLPRTTHQIGAWIENEFGVAYQGERQDKLAKDRR
jgi:hypothetical protein